MTVGLIVAVAIRAEAAIVLPVVARGMGLRTLAGWLLLVLGVNLVTIPALNLAAAALPSGRGSDVPWILVLEAVVVVAEAAAYAWAGRLRFLTAFLASLFANAASLLLGVIGGLFA